MNERWDKSGRKPTEQSLKIGCKREGERREMRENSSWHASNHQSWLLCGKCHKSSTGNKNKWVFHRNNGRIEKNVPSSQNFWIQRKINFETMASISVFKPNISLFATFSGRTKKNSFEDSVQSRWYVVSARCSYTCCVNGATLAEMDKYWSLWLNAIYLFNGCCISSFHLTKYFVQAIFFLTFMLFLRSCKIGIFSTPRTRATEKSTMTEKQPSEMPSLAFKLYQFTLSISIEDDSSQNDTAKLPHW